jgi:hypothetical protein
MAPLGQLSASNTRALDWISVVIFVAVISDLGHFSMSRQLMAYLGWRAISTSSAVAVRHPVATASHTATTRQQPPDSASAFARGGKRRGDSDQVARLGH